MNNFKSQKTSLARTTLGLVCAQKSNRLIRYLVFVVMAVGLTACGGGGSSSGGGSVVATITYTGSYRTQFYNGSITIQIQMVLDRSDNNWGSMHNPASN